jgi:hypothetical protein
MTSGPLCFARFAYPPNVLGYCGPAADRELLERTAGGADDPDLRRLARSFDGAWPYLELIAHANGLADPLDARVVESYWVGGPLLDRITAAQLADSLERFAGRAGGWWDLLTDPLDRGARPHHSFHVFAVYPWVGLLRAGHVEKPLQVLDRCRIRWGTVLEVSNGHAVVSSRPLTWDGRSIGYGPQRPETVRHADDGYSLVGGLAPGNVVAMHWDWVCDRLDGGRLERLQRATARTLRAVNAGSVPAPAAVLS